MKTIPLLQLLYMIIPLGVVGFFYAKWVDKKDEIILATLRMSVQLLLVGYVLTLLFTTNSLWLLSFLVMVMIVSASLIVRRNMRHRDWRTFVVVFGSIGLMGSVNLAWVLWVVLDLDNHFEPRFIIPLAGMIYANAMNAISLCAERYEKEKERAQSHESARSIAFKASMMPQINSFLAVGIVSLPGTMTGQILSGVDPLIAVRYQIVVMAMILSSGAMSNIMYLYGVNSAFLANVDAEEVGR